MASKPDDANRQGSTLGGPRAIGELAGKLVARPMAKRGFAVAALVGDWAAIVGSALADSTLPLRVAFPRGARNDGTLHLKVSSGAMALQLQHLGPLIIERVNGHFGYRAVARLAFVQGPLRPCRAARRCPPTPKNKLEAKLAGRIEAVPDAKLREALDGSGDTL